MIQKLKILLFICTLFISSLTFAQNTGKNYAFLISGLGGGEEYSNKFYKYLFETRKALIERFQFPEANIVVLAEKQAVEKGDFITDIAKAEIVKKHFADLASKVTDRDDVYIILFGHGSYDGKNAKLNIPRKDLTDTDYADLVESLKAARIVFINTASCSSPFISHLSAPNRIIITATKSGTQRNATLFPQFFVEALRNPAADMDKNGDLSVLEVFGYATESTFRWYEDNNHLPTEHAMLEDTGDKTAYRAKEMEQLGEGILAGVTYLKRRVSTIAENKQGSRLVNLLLEKEEIERKISELKSKKTQMIKQEYYLKLEEMFVRLAKINDRLEKEENI